MDMFGYSNTCAGHNHLYPTHKYYVNLFLTSNVRYIKSIYRVSPASSPITITCKIFNSYHVIKEKNSYRKVLNQFYILKEWDYYSNF